MKNFLLLFFFGILGMVATTQAQMTNIDFEAGGNGADWTWVMDQNADNPPLQFPANPVSGTGNTTATVAEFTARAAGNPWALTYTDDIDIFEFDATNSIVTIQVYKDTLSDVAIKFEGSSPAIEIKVANTLVNQWETLTFDFSAQIGNSYNRLVIIPDFTFVTRSADRTIYFDNVMVPTGNVTPPTEPTVGAPVPTHNEMTDNVFSIFSDTYTDLANTDFNPNWGQLTIQSFEDIAGNNTNKYANLNYQGTQLDGGQDLTGHGFIHIDFWTPDAATLEFYLISLTTGERKVDLPIQTEQWVSVDIPLSTFTDQGLSIADIHQFKVVGNGLVFFDNWYFHGNPPAVPTVAAPTPTHNEMTDNVLSIFSNAYTDLPGTDFDPNWGQQNDATIVDVMGNSTLLYTGLDYQGTQFAAAQDVSGKGNLHIDFWSTDATLIEFSMISQSGGEQKVALPIQLNQWVSVDIPMHVFAGLGLTLTDIHQFKVDGDGSETVYFDNWYFYGDYFAPPTGPPAVPTHDPTDNQIISVFNDVYTNISGINYNPWWGQQTIVSFEDYSGNFLMKYENLNYQGIDFAANPQDVSGLDFLHVDFYANESTDLGIFLISPGPTEHEFIFTITPNAWNSIDIPLSHFATGAPNANGAAVPVDLTNIIQLKVDGNGDIWWDNIYFWATAPLPVELTDFKAEAQETQVELLWETASEYNTDYFQIEKATNDSEFYSIAHVNAAGVSESLQTYVAYDENPARGMNYYRLRQFDADGTEVLSEVIGVEYKGKATFELLNKRALDNEVTLEYNVVDAGDYTMRIVDLSGKVIFEQGYLLTEGFNQIQLNIENQGLIIAILDNGYSQVVEKIFK